MAQVYCIALQVFVSKSANPLVKLHPGARTAEASKSAVPEVLLR